MSIMGHGIRAYVNQHMVVIGQRMLHDVAVVPVIANAATLIGWKSKKLASYANVTGDALRCDDLDATRA
jgi:hypothetical protein